MACLAALRDLSYGDYFVVLVDNGCAEFSEEEATSLLPAGHYLRTPENLGFAGGSNRGARQAVEAGAEWIWFLNNDAYAEQCALQALIDVAGAEPPADVVGAKILRAADPRRIDSVALRVDLRRGRIFLVGHDETDRGQYDALRSPDAVTGCAMLVSRAAWQRLGGFDESYFAYLEDADLCLRARAAGYRVATAPAARVLHDRDSASGARQSAQSLYYTTRNHLRLMRRHGGRSALRTSIVVALNAAYALRVPGPGSVARLSAVCRGVRDGLRDSHTAA